MNLKHPYNKMDFIKGVKNTFDTKHGSSTITHLLTDPVTNVVGSLGTGVSTVYKDGRSATSTIYKDGRSAVSFTGKHLINDVDTLSSTLSNPLLILGVVIVGAVIISKM